MNPQTQDNTTALTQAIPTTHTQQTEHDVVLDAASLPPASLVVRDRLLLHPIPPSSALLHLRGGLPITAARVLCLQTTNDTGHVFDRRGGCHAVGRGG